MKTRWKSKTNQTKNQMGRSGGNQLADLDVSGQLGFWLNIIPQECLPPCENAELSLRNQMCHPPNFHLCFLTPHPSSPHCLCGPCSRHSPVTVPSPRDYCRYSDGMPSTITGCRIELGVWLENRKWGKVWGREL